MKRTVLVLVLVAIPLVGGTAPGAVKRRCSLPRAKTQLATYGARVFSVRNGYNHLYACMRKGEGRTPRSLGYEGPCRDAPQAWVIGLLRHYVGYVRTTCREVAGGLEERDEVRVLDLATGRLKYRAPAAGIPGATGRASPRVMGIEMRSNGSVVWMATANRAPFDVLDPDRDDTEIRKLEPGSPANGTLVASGHGFDFESLALVDPRGGPTPFYWRDRAGLHAGSLD